MYSSKDVIKVSFPIALGLLAQNVIQITDTVFLGRVGEVEFGASGLAGVYYIIFFMIGFGFSVGAQIMISRRNGEQNYREIGRILVQGILFLLLLASLLYLLSSCMANRLLSTLLHSPDVLKAAENYLNYRTFGFFFSFANVMFRAFYVGIARTNVLTLNTLVMAVVNIAADYLLIFGHGGFPEMGIAGAGIASVIAEVSSVLFFVIYTCRTIDLNKYGFKRMKFNFNIIRRILSISVFTMVQYVVSMSTWFVFFLAIENHGERDLAVTNIVRSLYMLFFIPINALSTTANTLVGNTIGAGKAGQALPLIRKICLMSLCMILLVGVLIAAFPSFWISLIASDKSPSLIAETVAPVLTLVGIMPVCSVGAVLFNAVSGTGNTSKAMTFEVVTMFFYCLGIWLIVIEAHAPVAICWTVELIYWGLLLLMSYFYLHKGNWQSKQI
ncbi:MAG: MATE family efflux transporter [Prevotella sp.]|jgi:putative MATE family efflux protein|nr:MATE family efflux transporter [Prevotella sp.]